MFKKILVPLDGSAFAEAALPFALTLSRKAGCRLELVSVEESELTFAHPEFTDAGREWSHRYLETTAERVMGLAGGGVTTRLLEGMVWESLVNHVAESSVDLVVMASHGRGAFSRVWLGSVTDSFLRHTDRPVLLVRPDESEPASLDTDWAPESILLPLDGSQMSRSILEPAIALGSLFGARYRLLQVLAYPTEIASPYLPDTFQMNVELVERAKSLAQESLQSEAVKVRGRGLDAKAEIVVDAQAAHAILKRAGELNSGIIAMATHGRTGFARFVLGSNTDKVIRGSHCPVLVVKPKEEG